MPPYFQAGVLLWVLAGIVAGHYGAPPANSYPAPLPYGPPPQVVQVPVPGPIDHNQPDFTNVRAGKHHGAFSDGFADNYKRHHRDRKRHDRSGRTHRRKHSSPSSSYEGDDY